MNALTEKPARFEFSFPRLGTVASVECRSDEVLIRTSRDAFSEERKAAFVCELASEGFIPDHYRWLHSANGRMSGGVRWLVDPAWWMPSPEVQAHTSRQIVRVLAASAALWLAMMVVLIWRAAH
jgi:hypothetical protein